MLLGLLINVASFWCLSVTSGTTYSFVGASNKIPTAVLGHVFFASGLTVLGWVGIIFGLAAGLGYAVSKAPTVEKSEPLSAASSPSASSEAHGGHWGGPSAPTAARQLEDVSNGESSGGTTMRREAAVASRDEEAALLREHSERSAERFAPSSASSRCR